MAKRVFISSTSKDLAAHRNAARDAVLSLGYQPVMMEYFDAIPADPLTVCKEKVLSSNLFIGIYGQRCRLRGNDTLFFRTSVIICNHYLQTMLDCFRTNVRLV